MTDNIEKLHTRLKEKQDLLRDLPYGSTPLTQRKFHEDRLTISISQIKEKLNRMAALQEALRALPHFQEPPYNYDYRSGLISSVITPLHYENEREFLERAVKELQGNV